MDKKQTKKQREALVIKSNELIRNTRYQLNEQQQKLLIYLISRINRDSEHVEKVTIKIRDYFKVANLKVQRNAYDYCKESLKSLADIQTVWIRNLNNNEQLFRWIDTVEIKRGTAEVTFSQAAKPYLINLKDNFTKYRVIDGLLLKGRYTVPLFELFQSFLWLGTWEVDIDHLREILDCKHKYEQYKEFNRNVLKPALEEINGITDLVVTVDPIKVNKKIVALKFTIDTQEGVQLSLEDRIKIMRAREERLGHE